MGIPTRRADSGANTPAKTTHGCGTVPDFDRLSPLAFPLLVPVPHHTGTTGVNHPGHASGAPGAYRGEVASLLQLPDVTRLPLLGLDLATGAVEDMVSSTRRSMAIAVRRMVVGDRPVRDISLPLKGDPGLFGPDSVTWKVHADSAMFVGGLRALLLQTMHPRVMAGVADHSAYRNDPLGRLTRTAEYVGVTTFGTTAEADEMVAMVRKVHTYVVGTTPGGEPYEANDPHLMLWVHHALVDSFLTTYQRYGASRLTDHEADRYVAEMSVVADRLGCDPAATSTAGLRHYFATIRPELGAGTQARDAARWLLMPPLPLAVRPTYAVITGAAIGLLPGWVRRQLWLPLAPGVDPVVVRPSTTMLLRTLDWVMAGHPAPEKAATS